jgi:hypothetical protein
MANVRVFAFPGLTSLPISSGGSNRPNSDSLYVLTHPATGRANLAVDTVTPVTTAANLAPAKTKMLQIQVDPGIRVHMEITPSNVGAPVAADSTSIIISGETLIHFGEGWRASFLQVTES